MRIGRILRRDPERGVRLPRPAEPVLVGGEPRSPLLTGAARDAAVVDEHDIFSGGNGVVGRGVDLEELHGGDDRGVGGEAVEAEVGSGGEGIIAGGGKGEEIGVGAVGGGVLMPRGAPAEEDGGGEGDVEGRGVGLGVVVVVEGEGAEEEAGGG